jgi:hypothetical protein
MRLQTLNELLRKKLIDKSISLDYVHEGNDYTQYGVLSRIKVCTLCFS